METSKLKKFAQYARRYLIEQVSAKLKFVLAKESPARRENPKAVQDLEMLIADTSQARVIEKVAYIWFNRFCALRFMDVNRYVRIGIVSPAEGQFQPEILAEAKMGHIDEEMIPDVTRQKVFNLLTGSAPSRDPQQEAYHLLIVAVCNYYNKTMPFMFEKIADYTELLIPDDLLSGNSILAYTREAMTLDVCKNIEVIGWLYQFYISEKKDEVFEGLKKNKKITPENIPAATQLFTPHYIVRYLVENSLGRLWMLNRPKSRLLERMDYFIKPSEPEPDFLRITKPEEIKLCDPASGSGHMLTYSFDLLYAIYEEEGYDANDIPRLILEHNLFGIEIDERAGALAAFALIMKARQYDKRIFSRKTASGNRVEPSICVLLNVLFEEGELRRYMDAVGRDLFTANLQTMLHQFREADILGSLIRPEYADASAILRTVQEKNMTADLFLKHTHERVLRALKQAEYLRPKYHIVITNPPYMGVRGMNGSLKVFAQKYYPDSKSDLFAMFIERNLYLTIKYGMVAMITMQGWMFLSSFGKLRANILSQDTVLSMAHLGARAFDSIGGEVVSTTAFVLANVHKPEYEGSFLRLIGGNSEDEKKAIILKTVKNLDLGSFYRASATNFNKIPGSPIAYWLSKSEFNAFLGTIIEQSSSVCIGMKTGDNDKFVRNWHEVSNAEIGYYLQSLDDANNSKYHWFPYLKGGEYRKWHGNYELILNWCNGGDNIKNHVNSHGISDARLRPSNYNFYFQKGINWSFISSSLFGVRLHDNGFFFDVAGSSLFAQNSLSNAILAGYLNTKVVNRFLAALNPTLNMQIENIKALPSPKIDNSNSDKVDMQVKNLKKISKRDWDSYETSWDFTGLLLLHPDCSKSTLSDNYNQLRAGWREMTIAMQRLEEENNRIFIEAYSLKNELKPDVPLNEITLTCNPHYRYGNDMREEELEAMLLADTIKELLSYAVGCMFGRYSLDKPGLIIANQGDEVKDYIARVPKPTFEPDEDNVIPILDEGWFIDDITDQFSKFLKVTFGEQHYEENLAFIENAIGKDVRKYFLKDFYSDHLKRYKKRPIYWLFSSPKGSFNALIYMHRYRPDTVSVVLNDYLRELRTKLSARKDNLEQISISVSASAREKTQALKDIEKLRKMIDELDQYEREILYPLATKQISIDLDNGVKVNYLKFGDALRKIPSLEAKEED